MRSISVTWEKFKRRSRNETKEPGPGPHWWPGCCTWSISIQQPLGIGSAVCILNGSTVHIINGSTVLLFYFLILWRFGSVVEVNFPIIGGSYFKSHTTVNCHFPPRCRRLTSKMKASQEVVLLGIVPCCRCWWSSLLVLPWWCSLGGPPWRFFSLVVFHGDVLPWWCWRPPLAVFPWWSHSFSFKVWSVLLRFFSGL